MPVARMVQPSCNPVTLKDGRGGIFTFIPGVPVVEWSVLFTKAGEYRGFHLHKEFGEFVTVTSGHGAYWTLDGDLRQTWKMGPGDCIFFPPETPHTFVAISDVSMVACLTKKWDDCEEPITPVDFDG